MEPEKTPLEKENHLPNYISFSRLNFGRVYLEAKSFCGLFVFWTCFLIVQFGNLFKLSNKVCDLEVT